MFCSKCGNEINDEAVICPKCGCAVKGSSANGGKSWVSTYLLCWFLGCFGAHRFYTGYIGIGIAQLFTLGGCGIWSLVDFISLSFNNFKTADDKELNEYVKVLGMIGFGILIFGIFIYILLFLLGFAGALLGSES